MEGAVDLSTAEEGTAKAASTRRDLMMLLQ
jgi:hypothetical protein